jgi:hypothetical protein
MEGAVFSDVTLHGLAKITDVSEEHAASIFIYSAFLAYSPTLKMDVTCSFETLIIVARLPSNTYQNKSDLV